MKVEAGEWKVYRNHNRLLPSKIIKAKYKFKVGDMEVSVVRDTGCKLAIVRTSLVRKNQMLEKRCLMLVVDGPAQPVHVVKIYIDTPYIKEKIKAMCVDTVVYD